MRGHASYAYNRVVSCVKGDICREVIEDPALDDMFIHEFIVLRKPKISSRLKEHKQEFRIKRKTQMKRKIQKIQMTKRSN